MENEIIKYLAIAVAGAWGFLLLSAIFLFYSARLAWKNKLAGKDVRAQAEKIKALQTELNRRMAKTDPLQKGH